MDRPAEDRVLERHGRQVEIAFSVPEDAAEVRYITLSNNGQTSREIELTSYGEIVLGPVEADRAHPAFANLFVETEWHEWCTAITATRRPRSAGSARTYAANEKLNIGVIGLAGVGAIDARTLSQLGSRRWLQSSHAPVNARALRIPSAT